MNSVVTNRQIFFLILFTLSQVSLISIPRDAIKASGTGAWLSILILTAFFSCCIFFIASLNKRFEGKTLCEYSSILFGKLLAKIISFFYFCFFLSATIILFRSVSSFIKMSTLYKTPRWIILLIFLLTVLYIASKGITNIGRLCEVYGVIFIAVSLAAHTAEFFVGDINYIQPFFETNQIRKYVFGIKDLIVPFLGIEFLTIVPFGKINRKKGVLFSVLGVVYVGLFYIFAVETSVMIVGINDILNYDASLVEALHQTQLPSTFLLERFDLLFLTVGTIGILSGLCILFFVTVEYSSKLFMKSNRKFSYIAVTVVVFVLSGFVLDDKMARQLLNSVIPLAGLFTSFVIPFLLFVVSKVKKYEH